MIKLLKILYKTYCKNKEKKAQKILKNKFPDSIISSTTLFNNCTLLEGNNVIHANVNICNTKVGFGTYICARSRLSHCLIGKFCSISTNVCTQSYMHPTSFVSSYPGFYNTISDIPFGKGHATYNEYLTVDGKYEVIIGNDVWIGENVTIKGGLTIGDGAIIGMGSIVTKNVPPYSIVGGVPAKIIKYRFDEETIKSLRNIRWWDWPIELIKERRDEFAHIESFIKKYKIN